MDAVMKPPGTFLLDAAAQRERYHLNKGIVGLLRPYVGRRGGLIILDGEQGLTSKMVVRDLGVRPRRIYVPNPAPLIDTPGTHFPYTLYQGVRDAEGDDRNVAVVYDAMCTWGGNKTNVIPKADLMMMFGRRCFARRAVLTVTLSLYGLPVERRVFQAREIKEFLKETADKVTLGDDKPTMTFRFYGLLQRQTRGERNNFHRSRCHQIIDFANIEFICWNPRAEKVTLRDDKPTMTFRFYGLLQRQTRGELNNFKSKG